MKKYFFWIVELFIWLLILFVIAGGMMFVKYNYKKNFNTYQIFLLDVDGLINGSPVKLMGIQIGYVNQLDIVGDDVYVKFIITDPKVRIPRGSRATVEFSGLGGSKSLEIYPSKSGKFYSDKLLTPQNPKRIHDSLGLLNGMFDQVIEITYTASRFMDKVGIIRGKKVYNEVTPTKSADEVLKSSNDWLDRAQNQTNKFGNKLDELKNNKTHKKNVRNMKNGEVNEQSGAKNE